MSLRLRGVMVKQANHISAHNIHPCRPSPARILLVDDDPALLEALWGTLQNRLDHFRLDTCDTAMKALDCVTARHYDTIISDIKVPGINGLEFLTQVRQIRPLVPVVMISGHADQAAVFQGDWRGGGRFYC